MSHISAKCDELRASLERLRGLLDALTVRGLRACGADELAQLQAYADDLERSGAAHVATALATLHTQTEKGERKAARAMLEAQTSVRLLERLLTLRVARGQYQQALAIQEAAGAAPGGTAAGDDEAEDEG